MFRRSWIALALVLSASPARANGAFPDSGQLLVSAERPAEMTIGTNFGLILSEDAGLTWEWVCEGPETAMGRLYQLGEGSRLFSISNTGLVYTDDRGCTWQRAGGALARAIATDAFVDRTRPRHLLAAAVGEDGTYGLYASTDGGTTFGDALLEAEPGNMLTSIESSRSSPNVLYVASLSTTFTRGPRLHRSDDGGATWLSYDVPTGGPSDIPRIVQVDPEDPLRVILRVAPAYSGDSLLVTTDGGATFRNVVSVNGRFTAFLRRADGTLLTGGESGPDPIGFRSTDGGDTFVPWQVTTRLRGLAEHDGKLLAATNDAVEGYAVAASADDGATWEPVTSYGAVRRIKQCAAAKCLASCQAQVALSVWPASVCSAEGNTGEAGEVVNVADGGPPDGAVDRGEGAVAQERGCALSPAVPSSSAVTGDASFCVLLGVSGLRLLAARAGRRRPPTRPSRAPCRAS